MNYSINDELRNKIIDKNSMENTIQNLNNLDNDVRNKIVKMFLSDYFKLKILNYILNNDLESLNNFISSSDDIKSINTFDEVFLECIIDSSNKFNSLSYISKISLFEILSNYGLDNHINSISNAHIIDRLNYQFNYDLEEFNKYYIDFKTKNHLFKDEDASKFIAEKLISFSKDNFDEYKNFVSNFIKIYYKWTFFVSNNFNKNSLYPEDYIYMGLISLNDLDTIVNYSIGDIKFLETIIDNYLFYSTSEKEISEPIVDEYYNKNVDDNLQKKFKMNK